MLPYTQHRRAAEHFGKRGLEYGPHFMAVVPEAGHQSRCKRAPCSVLWLHACTLTIIYIVGQPSMSVLTMPVKMAGSLWQGTLEYMVDTVGGIQWDKSSGTDVRAQHPPPFVEVFIRCNSEQCSRDRQNRSLLPSTSSNLEQSTGDDDLVAFFFLATHAKMYKDGSCTSFPQIRKEQAEQKMCATCTSGANAGTNSGASVRPSCF